MGGDDTAFTQSTVQELEVRLLEESFCGTLWVRAVRDDHIKGILVVLQELESVANMDLHLGVVEADAHAWEVLLAKTDDGLVNVTQNRLFHALVLDHLSQDAAITARYTDRASSSTTGDAIRSGAASASRSPSRSPIRAGTSPCGVFRLVADGGLT